MCQCGQAGFTVAELCGPLVGPLSIEGSTAAVGIVLLNVMCVSWITIHPFPLSLLQHVQAGNDESPHTLILKIKSKKIKKCTQSHHNALNS